MYEPSQEIQEQIAFSGVLLEESNENTLKWILRALWKGNYSCCVIFLKDYFCEVNQKDQDLKKFLQRKANFLHC